MQFRFDALVYAALAAVLVVIGIGAFVIKTTPEQANMETRKLRFAAATFTGITMLFVFVSVLYFSEPNGPGQQIFDKGLTAMFTLAGTIVGYLFGSDRSGQTPHPPSSEDVEKRLVGLEQKVRDFNAKRSDQTQP